MSVTMSDQRIILANDSRLLREILNRILLKADNLDVVQDVSDFRKLPAVIEHKDAEWVILSMQADKKLPEWIDAYLCRHPYVKVLSVSSDGSWMKIKWLDSHEQDIADPSLQDLIHILEGRQGDGRELKKHEKEIYKNEDNYQ